MEGKSSNSLQEFLETEWTEWKDDDFARAHFKAFTGQKQDWEERINFWKDVIIRVARHLNLMIIDTEDVHRRWFVRDGVVPMGLKHVLRELIKSGELETVDQVLGSRPSTLETFTSFFRKAIGWAGFSGEGDAYLESEAEIEARLVVRSILQERTSLFIKSLAEGQFSSISIATLSKIKELCGGAENAELIIGYLLLQQKAKYIKLNSMDQIEGFKICRNEKHISAVSENDEHLLQLHWTMETLQLRLNAFDSKIATIRGELLKSAKAGNRREALRRLRNMKLLQLSRDQCAGFMDKIEQVLGVIADAETSKRVTEAIKVGTDAIKQHHVSLDDVHTCLSELDDAISVQRETEDAIAETPLSSLDEDDTSFEEELATLEKELSDEEEIHNLPNVPEAIQPPAGQKFHLEQSQAEDDLEKEFAKLAVELG